MPQSQGTSRDKSSVKRVKMLWKLYAWWRGCLRHWSGSRFQFVWEVDRVRLNRKGTGLERTLLFPDASFFRVTLGLIYQHLSSRVQAWLRHAGTGDPYWSFVPHLFPFIHSSIWGPSSQQITSLDVLTTWSVSSNTRETMRLPRICKVNPMVKSGIAWTFGKALPQYKGSTKQCTWSPYAPAGWL